MNEAKRIYAVKNIKVLIGISEKDEINYPIFDRIKVSNIHVRRYGGSRSRLFNLNGTERFFLDYLTEVMDEKNRVTHNHQLRKIFMDHTLRNIGIKLSDGHVKRIFMKLTHSDFLLKGCHKGEYFINPVFFTKNNSNREGLIKELVEVEKIDYKILKNMIKD